MECGEATNRGGSVGKEAEGRPEWNKGGRGVDARGKADAQEQEQVVDGEARVLGKGPHGCSRGRGGLLRWGTTGHSRVLGTLRCLGKAQVNRGCKGWEGVCVEARADGFAALAAAGLVARTRVSLVGIPSKARPVIGGGYERVAWGVCFPGVATAQAGHSKS